MNRWKGRRMVNNRPEPTARRGPIARPYPPHTGLQTTIALIALVLVTTAMAESVDVTTLFQGGADGYHTYRIPALVRSPDGTILAFCEGRKNGPEDYGDIDLVYRRSMDNGKTWTPTEVLIGTGDATWGNPTPVADRETGRVWLFLSYNDENHNQYGNHGYTKIAAWGDRRIFVTHSDDQGLSWSIPEDRTESLVPKDYRWDAVGPGNGIQTTHAPHPGRLIVPAIGRNLYSDDHGATWHYQRIGGQTSEGTIVERSDGRLLRNDRSVKKLWEQHKRRMVSIGQIGEEPWGEWHPQAELPTPRCQASSIRFESGDLSCLLFLNPASTTRRWKMRLRTSNDDGKTWEEGRTLPTQMDGNGAQQGGYSSLVQGANEKLLALVEFNPDVRNRSSHKSIVLHRFSFSWIQD